MCCERILFRMCEISSFFNFGFRIQTFFFKNVWCNQNFEIQTNCYFALFLEPRIWEIVPFFFKKCIKKVIAFRILNWSKKKKKKRKRKKKRKKKNGLQKTSCKLSERFLPKVVFYNMYNMPVNFLCSMFYHFYVALLFCTWVNFRSVLSFIVIFVNSVRKN